MQDTLQEVYRQFIFDNGPLYQEFHPHKWIKEPWNAYSSLLFFISVFFWLWKLKGQYKKHFYITLTLPFLFLNGLGSTLFHAFRIHDFFFYLDFVPAAIMSTIVAVYLWNKIVQKWYWSLLIIFAFRGLGIWLHHLSGGAVGMNINYFITGITFFAPLIFILFKTRFFKWQYVLLTFISLAGALTFRVLDKHNPLPEIMPQSTHFLWHTVSAFAPIFLGYYIYYLNSINIWKYPKNFPHHD